MTKIRPNPYRPGAGTMPAFLAGRNKITKEATEILDAITYGYPTRSIIYYGLRGVGKTVLLSYIENLAVEKNVPVEYFEVPEREYKFESAIAFSIYKLLLQLNRAERVKNHLNKALRLLKAFTIKYSIGSTEVALDIEPMIGIADTGNLANDTKELFLALGLAAQKAECGAVLLLDEIQYLKKEHFEILMQALHRANQKGYSVMIFAAGLPKVIKEAGAIKSYAERLFSFVKIDSLNKEDAALALTEPVKRMKIKYSPAAIEKIINVTAGYPYFLQEYGSFVWKYLTENSSEITLEMVNNAYQEFQDHLDDAFFKVRYDRSTPKELEFMLAMAKCSPLPCSIKQIAIKLNSTVQVISTIRAQLIHKGYIYAAARGMLNFTVPQFDNYLKRMYRK